MIIRVVAAIPVSCAVGLKRQDLRRDLIEKKAVVADRDDRSGILIEGVFECLASRYVEVVGRLIEDQDIFLRIDQLRERKPSLFAAGKIRNKFENIFAEKQKAVRESFSVPRYQPSVQCVAIPG